MKSKTRSQLLSLQLLSFIVFAQEEKPADATVVKHAMNIFKINLTSIVLKNYSFPV
jgi:hypothetical protein